MMIWID